MTKFANRAKMSISSTGTGNVTLNAAEPGYQTFGQAGIVDSDQIRYIIEDGTAWEIGIGLMSSSVTVMARTVQESSNSGSALNLTSAAKVLIGVTAADFDKHGTGNGYQHIPQDGAANQLLQYSSAGTAAWLTNDFVSWQSAWPADAGTSNIALGENALSSVSSTGKYNVGIGKDTLSSNTTADYSVAIGYQAAMNNNQSYNVAIGSQAMLNATSALSNVAIGYKTLFNNNDNYNTAIGYQAMYDATSVDGSVAVGYRSLYNSLTDTQNVAVGNNALYYNVGGNYNTALGYDAGYDCSSGDYNTFIGWATAKYTSSYFTGSNCTLIGRQAYSNASNSNRIYLGNSSITNLYCNDTSISSLSDERDKTNIVSSPFGLAFINDVRPVTFTWNRRDGSMATSKQLGFVSQEVHDVELKHSSTGYTKIVDWSDPERLTLAPARMLPIAIKAIQELSSKIDALEARLAKLEQ